MNIGRKLTLHNIYRDTWQWLHENRSEVENAKEAIALMEIPDDVKETMLRAWHDVQVADIVTTNPDEGYTVAKRYNPVNMNDELYIVLD